MTDIPFGRVFRVSQDAEWELITEYDGWPNGLKIRQDGHIFITCYRRGIVLLNPDNGAVTSCLETAGSESFKGVNDLPSGSMVISTLLLRVRPVSGRRGASTG